MRKGTIIPTNLGATSLMTAPFVAVSRRIANSGDGTHLPFSIREMVAAAEPTSAARSASVLSWAAR